MRTLLFAIILFFASCQKEDVIKCEEVTIEYYTNYVSYWDYCRWQTDEINTTLVFHGIDIDTVCSGDIYYKGLDTILCREVNCPRIGSIFYQVRKVYK